MEIVSSNNHLKCILRRHYLSLCLNDNDNDSNIIMTSKSVCWTVSCIPCNGWADFDETWWRVFNILFHVICVYCKVKSQMLNMYTETTADKLWFSLVSYSPDIWICSNKYFSTDNFLRKYLFHNRIGLISFSIKVILP